MLKGDEWFVQRTQDLRSLPVVTPGGQLVPLDSVAAVREFSSGPEQILHRERQRAITVQVSPAGKVLLGGLLVSTIITLVLVPVLLRLMLRPAAGEGVSRRATGPG